MAKSQVNEDKKVKVTKDAPLAKGGKVQMFGRGDRARTAPQDAAGPAKGGSTVSKTGSGGRDAKGGPKVSADIGGLSRPAKPA